MRQVLLIAVMALVSLTACKDKKGQVLDPDAKISIKPTTAKAQTQYLSPVEIVRLTTDIVMVSPQYPDEPYMNYMIEDMQKDLIAPKIMMWGMWVILKNELSPTFIEAKDVIFVTRQNQDKTKPMSDTLAYIPNAQLRSAEQAIKVAYSAKEYNEVYRLFDEAYKFTPINGKDWLELKRQGKN